MNIKKAVIIIVISILVLLFIIGIVILNVLSDLSLVTEEDPFKELNHYRKEITFDLENDTNLSNFQVGLRIDTLSLIRDEKLDFECSSIRFTDSDRETKIPYWIKGGCGEEDTEIWVNIPHISANEKKTIYISYSYKGMESESNAREVFEKSEDYLVGWYYLDRRGKNDEEILNFTNGQEKGNIVGGIYSGHIHPEGITLNEEKDYRNILFHNWRHKSYFEVPSEKLDFNKKKGSIEFLVFPSEELNLADECWGGNCSNRYQRLFIDSNWEMELGIDPQLNLYFYPSQAPEKNYISTDPLDVDQWSHVVVTWNFEEKEANIYVDGNKRSKNIDNLSSYWSEVAQTGDWQFGGTSLDIDSFFSGHIDGIRIYSKDLKEDEVKDAFRYNRRETRYPDIVFGKEEVLRKVDVKDIDAYKLKNLSKTAKISLVDYYVNPYDDYYYDFDSEAMRRSFRSGYGYYNWRWYTDPESEEIMFKIENDKDLDLPIFGGPGHISSYTGATIEFEESFLATHVAFKMNDPELIRDLKIQFLEHRSYEHWTKNNESYFSRLFPSAHACGPYGGYMHIGESKLSLIEEEDGIYWYEINNPIFVTKETQVIQFRYKPNSKYGKFSLSLHDIVFMDKNQQHLRASILESMGYEFDSCNIDGICGGSGKPTDKYRAYFVESTLGFIKFEKDSQKENLNVSFENKGEKPIKFTENTIREIKEEATRWTINNISIRTNNGEEVSMISMEEIEGEVLGKMISPGESLSFSIISLEELNPENLYYISLGTEGETEKSVQTNESTISRWILGDNPYYYPRNHKEDSLLVYRLVVGNDREVSIEEI